MVEIVFPITERVRNIPVFLTHKLADTAAEMKRRGEDVISLAASSVVEDTPAHLKEALKKALDEGYTRYPPLPGLYELREATAQKLKSEDGVEVDPNSQILITMGGQEAIFLTMQALVSPGDEVLMTTPCYPFDLHIRYAGGVPVFVPLRREDGFRLDAEEFERKITSRTRLITMVNPHNPSGRVFTRDEIEGIAEVAKKHDLLVLADIVNEKLVYDDRQTLCIASLSGTEERTVIENSFTKCFGMSGWRIGYCVANKEIIAQMTKLHFVTNNVGPPAFVQKAAAEVYRGPQEPLKGIVKRCEEGRNYAFKRFNEMPRVSCHKPEGTAVMIPEITAYRTSSLEFAEWLLKEGKVAVAAGVQYHAEGHVRVNFSEPRLKEALDRIEEALRGRRLA